jgi:hypothetical protein
MIDEQSTLFSRLGFLLFLFIQLYQVMFKRSAGLNSLIKSITKIVEDIPIHLNRTFNEIEYK